MWHRRVSRQLFHRCGGMQAVRWLRRKGVTILMYHKFPADMAMLESQCGYLRKHYQVMSLGRLSQLLRNGDSWPDWSVVITVDDGHGSFYRYAYPVFAKFDFPVTVYLTTRPLDTRGWFWFDRVAYAFLTSPRQEVDLPNPPSEEGVPSGAGRMAHNSMALGSRDQRLALAEQYMELMKASSEQVLFPLLEESGVVSGSSGSRRSPTGMGCFKLGRGQTHGPRQSGIWISLRNPPDPHSTGGAESRYTKRLSDQKTKSRPNWISPCCILRIPTGNPKMSRHPSPKSCATPGMKPQ